ncbi:MAG TPA: RNA polymerase sigma factor [Mycobacteriales bacterium]|jgi:RNA polymerase sigma-70 factor (ECF subfamily)|nr:RNA polymerase sigma factor [Mycobacteriales bacterium]
MGTALIGKQPARHARRRGSDVSPAAEPLDDALQRARAGDDSGFAELWRALHPRLLRYLRVRTRGNHEDVAAETWLHAVRDLSSFDGNADGFRAWLFTLARHRAIDAARAAAARPAVSVPDFSGVGRQPAAAPAETEALDRISTDRAIALVRRLPPDQADMVMLRVVAGLDVRVVAEIVGKSPGAVRVSVHRGLRALARDPKVRSEVV